MDQKLMTRCEKLIENRDLVKSVYRWENGLVHLVCAGLFSFKNLSVDTAKLEECKVILKEKMSIFSNFRGTVQAPVAAMMAMSDNPRQMLSDAMTVYELLKKDFWGSEHLVLAAMMIAQSIEVGRYSEIASKTRSVYNRMKADHPFLTDGADSTFCALMALSDKDENTLVSEAEACYQILKGNFFSKNPVQALSHVLALCEGKAEDKCAKTMELFYKLREAGCHYGKEYELPVLGVIAHAGGNVDEIASAMKEIDEWLKTQKDFGFFGSVNAHQRLMYAGILAIQDNQFAGSTQTAVLNGTISLIAAQNAAVCAAVAASSAAAAARNS